MDYEGQIGELRTRIGTLDASLDDQRTPYMKSQLRFAGYLLDDAESALRESAKASPNGSAKWNTFANFSVQHAHQIVDVIDDTAQQYGGPDKLTELG